MGTGGSRVGAGRPRSRGICEQSMPFDIRQLVRQKLLRPGTSFPWHWFLDEKEVASIRVHVGLGRIIIAGVLRRSGGGIHNFERRLEFVQCPGGFGLRQMFRCPRCGNSCAVVYFSGVTFACRKCLRLGYASEAENLIGRLWRKQKKIERRLAGGADEWDGAKPIGMHQSTFDRLICALDQIEREKSFAFTLNYLPSLTKIGFRLPSD
jgi:hypothetical protein